MIDLQQEHLLSLSDASRSLPKIDGKKPHISTLWRWCRRGVRGVHLDHVRLGHRICTSKEALTRFVNALAEVDSAQVERTGMSRPHPKPRTESARQKAIARAEAELEQAGI